VNYHTLADFRTLHVEWLDAQLTPSIASLLERKLVRLSVVSQDGMRVRAAAKAASFRRRGRLEKFLQEARAQVETLKSELDEDAGAGTRRKQAAREPAKKLTKGPDDTVPPDAGKPPKTEAEPRVSTSDPEARMMKMADGGYPKLQAIDAVAQRGTQPVMPPPRSRDAGIDQFVPKSTDSPNVARWRAFMASDEAKELYKQRAATIECTNAQVRRRGLYQLLVRGRPKARAVPLWHALAHNLMRQRSLNIAFQP
jgi:hypothetical protein